MNNLLKKLPEGVRQTLIASLPLTIVIILFLVVGNFGISKVLEVRDQIKIAQANEATISQKLNLLQTISGAAATGAISATAALPDSNPSLTVISQLKFIAAQSGVVLSSIKSSVGPLNSAGLTEADISFTADGASFQIFGFLDGTAQIAPITIVDKVKMVESAGAVRADINVKSFWAPLPKTIPNITQPITDLSANEKLTLTKINALIQPTFVQVTPSQGGVNTTPFGQ